MNYVEKLIMEKYRRKEGEERRRKRSMQ